MPKISKLNLRTYNILFCIDYCGIHNDEINIKCILLFNYLIYL
jgi:hypothetical protein